MAAPRPGRTCARSAARRGGVQAARRCRLPCRLIRSVARSGRQSEASLGIGGLQYPVMRRAAALAGERDLPAGAADPFMRQSGRGRRAGDPPAGERRRRRAERIRVRLAPAPQHQGHAAAFLGGELEPAGGGHGQRAPPRRPRRRGCRGAPLLHHRKHLLVVAAFGIEQAIGRQPRLGEARREQVAAGQRPEHLAALAPRPWRSARRARRGTGSRRPRHSAPAVAGAASCSAPAQPAAGQPLVDLADAERQARPPVAGRTGAFDPAHLLAQGGEARIQADGADMRLGLICSLLCSARSPPESRCGLRARHCPARPQIDG